FRIGTRRGRLGLKKRSEVKANLKKEAFPYISGREGLMRFHVVLPANVMWNAGFHKQRFFFSGRLP
ncbi:MAG: hypothetical protein KDC65_16215, partial [Saprospiraceae bacterium]|nr:hypothetical protein [Saprospiraceae bacterium]